MESTKEQNFSRLSVSFQKKPCYDIVFEHSFDRQPEELQKLFPEEMGGRAC